MGSLTPVSRISPISTIARLPTVIPNALVGRGIDARGMGGCLGIKQLPHDLPEKLTLKLGPVSGPRRRAPSTGPIGFAWAIRSSRRREPRLTACHQRLTSMAYALLDAWAHVRRSRKNVQEYKYVRLGVLILTMLAPLLDYTLMVITTVYLTSHNAAPCWGPYYVILTWPVFRPESITQSASSGTTMSPLTRATRRRSALGATSRSHSLVVWRHPRLRIVTRLGDLVEAVRICGYAVTRTHAVGGRAPMTLLYVTVTLSVCPIAKVDSPNAHGLGFLRIS